MRIVGSVPTQEETPALLDRGGKRKSRGLVGVRGDPSARKLGRRCLRRWLILIQPPRIAAFFQLVDNVINDREPFVLAQSLLQSANNLAGSPQGEGVSKDLTSCHLSIRTYRERMYKSLHLVSVISWPARREGQRNVRTFHRQGDLG